MDALQRLTYTKKPENASIKLVVFYKEVAYVDERSWSLNAFLNFKDHTIHEITFMQGVDREHDSYHVWYEKKEPSTDN